MKTEEDFHASPKKQKPLREKLESLSKKIHEAQYAVRNEKEQVIGFVSFELYHRIRAQERNKAIDEVLELLYPDGLQFQDKYSAAQFFGVLEKLKV